MWKRNQYKKRARHSLRSNLLTMLAVCFLMAMLTTAYASSTVFVHYYQPEPRITSQNEVITSSTNSDIVKDTVKRITHDYPRILDTPVGLIGKTMMNVYISGQSIIFSILKAINSLVLRKFEWESMFLIFGILFTILYKYHISNVLAIGEKRFFMEIRNYPKTKISKIFFLFKLRYIRNPIWIMFCRSVALILWSFTIVGGVVKYYEYYMIPYIIAENPAIDRKDAFRLSKRMMKGNKMKLFAMHCTFIGWQIVSLFTFGLLNLVFVNPYMAAANAEFYMSLRETYVKSRLADYECFNDPMLARVPSQDELLISKALYDDSEGPYTKISYFEPEQYPVFLFSIQPPRRAVQAPRHENRSYDFLSCIFLFFAFSMFGWLFESLMHLTKNGVFLHRGFLTGPWIPLYGICGLVLLTCVQKIAKWPVPAYLSMMAIYSAIEYGLNWLMEYEWNIIQIDYSGYLLNLNGRTFLGGATFFALLGCCFLYYLAPKWDDFFHKIPKKGRIAICVILTVLFLMDFCCAFIFPVS